MKRSFSIGLTVLLAGLAAFPKSYASPSQGMSPYSSYAWTGYSTGIGDFLGQVGAVYTSDVGYDSMAMDIQSYIYDSGVQPLCDFGFGAGNSTYGDYPFDLSCSNTQQWVGWDCTSFTTCWPSWSYCDWGQHPWPPCDGHHHPPCTPVPAPVAVVLASVGVVAVVVLRRRRVI